MFIDKIVFIVQHTSNALIQNGSTTAWFRSACEPRDPVTSAADRLTRTTATVRVHFCLSQRKNLKMISRYNHVSKTGRFQRRFNICRILAGQFCNRSWKLGRSVTGLFKTCLLSIKWCKISCFLAYLSLQCVITWYYNIIWLNVTFGMTSNEFVPAFSWNFVIYFSDFGVVLTCYTKIRVFTWGSFP